MDRKPFGRLLPAIAILAAGAVTVLASSEARAQDQDRTIEIPPIRVENIPPTVVAIAPIAAVPQREATFKAADEVREVLRFDLDFTGWFAFPENAAFVDEQHAADERAGTVNFAAWRSELQADYVVKGEYRETKPGRFQIKLYLYDTATGACSPARKYTGPERDLRASVHLFSDLVFKHLTGREGIAHTAMAFILDDGTSRELYFMDYDGANVRRKTRDQSIALYPAWSPDGKQLAFTSYRDHGIDLFLLDVFTGNCVRISDSAGINTQGTWSPDGQEICLTKSKPGNVELYRMPLHRRGAEGVRLTNSRAIESSPCWSPDGRQILFTSDRAGRPAIYTMDPDGGNIRRLTTLPGHCDNARWSPDGSQIAFQSNAEGEFNIYLMTADGSDVRRLTLGPGEKESPNWAPNGEHIVYSSSRRGPTEIYAVHVATGTTRRLTNLKGDALFPAWGP